MADIERKVKAGDRAPDFTLKDQDGNDFTLHSQKGGRVLLSFHPLAWTPVCTQQMQSLEENFAVFKSLNTLPVGMSVDPVPSKKAWAESIGVKKVPLLSDFWPHGAAAKLFDIFRDKNGFSERANISGDENGKIALLKTYPLSQLPDINEIIEFIRKL
ncbi:MAG: redoxin domain-containing protein [Chloroflexi bacterium]|nr:redoxin domain-containing protein [Chloroflexota bacterium]